MLKIYCKNTGTSMEFQEGVALSEVLPHFDFDRPYDILCAKVNYVTQGMKYRAFNNRDVEFLDYRSYAGRSAYCRSLCFLLSKATHDVFPDSTIKMRRPISKGYFCDLQKGSPVTSEDVDRIRARMQEIVEADSAFKRMEVRTDDAIELFRGLGYDDKVKLLETSGLTYVRYHTLEGTPDYYYDALVPSAGYLKVWELSQYQDGMLLRVPDRHNPERLTVLEPQPKTFEVFRESLMARFKIAYSDAVQMRIGLLIYKMFVEITNVASVIVPETNLRAGALINKLAAPNEDLQQDFYKQITAGALNLLRKYHGDEGHAQFVSDVSLKIFDALKNEIALDERARVLLQVAATLHDIGIFIRMENHHEHSAYIISNSEFFGLTQNEITIVSQIAKYHRGHSNPQDDDHFQMLPRASRMTILKLTAIIRIADAIDRSHTQKFTELKIAKQRDSLLIYTGNKHNTVLERQALGEKGGMFESVFGYKVILS